MNLRATFAAAKGGDRSAETLLAEIAYSPSGHPDAEALLMEEIRKVQLTSDFDFPQAFGKVMEAYPMLHRAYLNAN